MLQPLPTNDSIQKIGDRPHLIFSSNINRINGAISFLAKTSITLLDMPTLLRQDGFKFFFYANEHEPKHIHVI